MTNDLSEDQENWADDLIESLENSREAAGKMIEQLEALRAGEIEIEEYEEWTDENTDVLKDIEV